MPSRDPKFFGDRELDLLYIAKRLRDALKLEDALTTAGLDYVVETDTYHGGIIFRTQRTGAFFYVDPESLDAARAVVVSTGLRPYFED